VVVGAEVVVVVVAEGAAVVPEEVVVVSGELVVVVSVYPGSAANWQRKPHPRPRRFETNLT